MLKGLQRMDDSAKRAFVEELGLDLAADQEPSDALVAWMAEAVNAPSDDPQEVELAVLRWLARRLEIPGVESLQVDDLEAAARRKVAEDSHDFLFPFMEVGSAVAYLGPKTVVGPKLELLESSTAGIIPSHTARDRMRQYWQARGADLLAIQEHIDPHTLIQLLAEPISILKVGSESTKASVVALSHVVALSDGRFEAPEEQFTSELAKQLGLSSEKVGEIYAAVNQAFWKHLSDLGGASSEQRSTGEELAVNLQAAQMTLESCGSLASFSAVVEKGFVGSLHSTMGSGSGWAQKLKSWGKTPLRLPLGFATGMLCFIRDRWKSDSHETLLRLTLASIYQQHLEATADHAEISEDDLGAYLSGRTVENPAEVLAETVVGTSQQEPVRRITLEPTKFERP
jgi:hypothetical protein